MKRIQVVLVVAALLALATYSVRSEQAGPAPSLQTPPDLPFWAYGWMSPDQTVPTVPKPQAVRLPADDNVLLRIPGSSVAIKPSLFRRARGDEGVKEVPDWAPETHDPMPDIVRFGRSVRNSRGELIEGEDGGIRGCGVCHSATGIGRPENAAVYMRSTASPGSIGRPGSSDAPDATNASYSPLSCWIQRAASTDADPARAAATFAPISAVWWRTTAGVRSSSTKVISSADCRQLAAQK